MALQSPFFGKREPDNLTPARPMTHPQASTPATTAAPRSDTPLTPAPAAAPAQGSTLTVGPNIKLRGVEITDCDTLVVEGTVEATMDSRLMQIAAQGAFNGSAQIDVAEIRGVFDGTLTVRDRLVIHPTGRVSGTVRYGKLVIEEGGQLSGDVALHQKTAKPSLPAPA